MKGIIKRLIDNDKASLDKKLAEEEQLKRQVTALFGLLANLYGSDKLVLKAGKLEALHLMRSSNLPERVLALEKLVYEDPTIDDLPGYEEIPQVINEIEEEIADILARRTVEEKIEKKIAEKMQERHEDYVKDLKMQILKEEGGPDNAQTLKKFAELEKLEQKKLSKSALDLLRPTSVEEVVGQDRAVKAMFSKIASPFPQHVILYGPPGVGKTTVARLALEEAKKRKYTPFAADARFVEVDGATLRWDPREVTNPLLGSVHDPIYQGARRDLAEGGVPEPKPGLVTEAHGGVLFIDEIGELDPMLQSKLLKVLEDKRVTFDSAYYDPNDPNVPKYIKKLFDDGAPADFVLIGATTRDPYDINPALRSRSAEIYFEPLNQKDIQEIVGKAAGKLKVELDPDVPELISEYTIEGRKATGILADAFGLVLYRDATARNAQDPPAADEAGDGTEAPGTGAGMAIPDGLRITRADILEVAQLSRLSPYVNVKASSGAEVGKIFGLGVAGFLGSVLEIEAVAFPARDKGKGGIRFNETAGSMAKDSVFNAASVVRKLTGQELADYDVHVNIVGGGKIDGPSAGTAILMAIMSAVQNRPIRQDVAVTGEVSIQGKVKAVGGIPEKIYGAKQAGVRKVVISRENQGDVPKDLQGIEIVTVEKAEEAVPHIFA
ncbi:MAG: Lon family ATP-dependent protease [Firmicutes bacterium]|nr:Lon family ATP-dependent protease [Bacillota bacterium]